MTNKYEGLNDDQLRAEAQRRNLDTSGDHDALVSRLVESDNTSGSSEGNSGDGESGGSHGTQEDADRSGQRPAPGDPRGNEGPSEIER